MNNGVIFDVFDVGEASEFIDEIALVPNLDLTVGTQVEVTLPGTGDGAGETVNFTLASNVAAGQPIVVDVQSGESRSVGEHGVNDAWTRIDTAVASIEQAVLAPGAAAGAFNASAIAANVDVAPGQVGATRNAGLQVVFVDANVDNFQQLFDGIDPSYEVHIIDAGQDGVAFMASVLEGRSDIDAIHVISHGNQGRINLGTAVLDETSINGEYADALITIGNALSDNGDILIYGCNFADGEQGAAAIAALATATGADIASSTDATGHAGLGGNWDLEVQSGSIESDVVVSEAIQESWVNLLAPSTLDWAVEFGATTDILGTTANTTVNGTTVTVGVTQTGTFDSTPIAQILPTGSLNGVSGIVELYMNASADDTSAFMTTTLTFSQPVYNLNFSLIDLDGNTSAQTWSDRVTVTSDTGFATNVTTGALVDYDAATGTATSLGGNTNDAQSAVDYTFVQGVSTVTITYYADDAVGITNPGNQRLGIDDLTFENAPQLQWSVTGSATVTEGTTATYTIDLGGTAFIGQTASVDVSLADIDTDSADYQSFVAAVNTAIASRPEFSFNGTTLSYTAASATFTPLTIMLGTVDDLNSEGNEDFQIVLRNAGDDSAIGTPTSVTTAIIDDENPPVAEDDGNLTDQATLVSGNVLTDGVADSDPDGDTLSVSAVEGNAASVGTQITLASGALVTVNANGTYNYDPNGQFDSLAVGASTTDSFTYTISDGTGGTDDATVTVIVNGLNDDPTAANDATITSTDTPVAGNVLTDGAADSDPDGDTLSVSEVNGNLADVGVQITLGSGALLTLNSDGTYDYDPNGQFTGLAAGETATDSFTYTVSDGNGGTDTASVTITIGNSAPIAVDDDFYITPENLVLTINTANGILANDTDPDGDGLVVSNFSSSTVMGGNIIIAQDGSFSYTPPAGFIGTDYVVYAASDPLGESDTGLISIEVVGPPVATDDAWGTDEDTPINLDVLANDTTPGTFVGTGPVSVFGENWDTTKTDEPLITPKADGTVDFDPRGGTGTFTFNYTVTDSTGQSTTATATVVVSNTDETAAAADYYEINDGQPINLGGIVDNDFYTVAGAEGVKIKELPTNGNLYLAGVLVVKDQIVTLGNLANLTYQPDAGYTGPDQFLYELRSDGNSNAVVDISVLPPLSNPIAPVAADDAWGTDKETPITVDVLANDETPGTFDPATVLTSNHSWNIADTNKPQLSVNPDGTIAFDPNGNEGTFSFDYTVTDSTGQSTTATTTIEVSKSGQSSAAPDTYETNTDQSIVLDGIVENDFFDPDYPLNEVKIKDLPTQGDLYLNGTLVIKDQLIPVTSLGDLTYTPDSGYIGTDQFSYELRSQGNSTTLVDINVVPSEQSLTAPAAYDDAWGTDEVTPLTVNVLANDQTPGTFDPTTLVTSGHSWNTADTNKPSATVNPDGTIDFDPRGDNGIFTFGYTVTDSTGQTTTATATFVVSGTDKSAAADDFYETRNDQPIMLDGVLDNDFYSQPDASSNFKIKEVPTHGDLYLNGVLVVKDQVIPVTSLGDLTYQAHVGYVGMDQFKYELQSDGNSQAFVDIAVLPPAPRTESTVDGLSESFETAYAFGGFTSPTYTATGLPDGYVIDPNTGVISGTSTADGSQGGPTSDGIYDIVVIASEGTRTYSHSLQLQIYNLPPMAGDDSFAVQEAVTYSGTVVDNDLEGSPDADTLTYSVVNPTTDGTLVLNADGTFEYTANAGFYGTDAFTYLVDDGQGGTAQATVTFDVNGAPVATNNVNSVSEDGPATTGNVLTDGTADSDPEDDNLTVTAVNGNSGDTGNQITLASGALLTLNSDGTYDYDPNGAFNGLSATETAADSFTYTISDGNGGFDTATVSVTVNGENDAPTEIRKSYIESYREGLINCGLWNSLDVLAGSVLVDLDNVIDPDANDTHTFSIVDGTGTPVSDPDLEIINNELVVRSGASLAFDTITSRTVIIRVDDGNGGLVDQTYTFDLRFNAGPYNGSATNDIAFGTVGADTMQGGDGSDRIFADDGNDFLFGDAGSDILEGGAGADTIDGGSGRDGASYMGSAIGITVDMMNAGANTGDAIGDSFISIEALWGSSFDDSLYGDNSNNTLVGSYGDDVIAGRGGDDLIQGGPGNDVYIFKNGDGNDTIMDFVTGPSLEDVVDLSDFGFADFAALQSAMSEIDGYVMLQLDADDSLKFWGIGNISQFDEDDFIF